MTIQEKAHKIAELTDTTSIHERYRKWKEEVDEVESAAYNAGQVSIANEARSVDYRETLVKDAQSQVIAELRDVIITTLSLAQALGCPDLLALTHVKADEVIARLQNGK